MKSVSYPINLPEDLYGEIRRTAKKTQLAMADVMRQAIKAGLPRVEEQFSPLAGLKPATDKELQACYSKPNPEFDALEHHCAQLKIKTKSPFEDE